jgi:23S rRNA U2552 (ribose-2'-O)-methylase RlmE/FtsJ
MKKQSLCIKVPPENIKLLDVGIISQKNLPSPVINIKENDYLKFYKNKIDELPNNKQWDTVKKITNEYELIHIPTNKKRRNESIAFYNPLSRSYYKMVEILNDFNLLENYNYNKIKTAHIAEGPGGFIEALINKRKNSYDEVNAITLKSCKKEIPGWRKAKIFLERHPNIKIYYGKDDTGDIYNVDNIIDFREKVGFNSCDLITADGGFDFSIDFNKQEQLSSRLIFCEIVTALSVQKKGGDFICKFFDSYTNITIKLLWLLNCLYEKIVFTKPFTSRPANSEKYILAQNFKGINIQYLQSLYEVVRKWGDIENKNEYIEDVFKGPIDSRYINLIEKYNKFNMFHQIQIIKETLDIIKENLSIDENQNTENQISNALEWCKKYNIDINFGSFYLQNYDKYKQYFDVTKYEKWKINKFNYS